MISTIFLLAALILFIIGTFPVSSRFNLISAGLACYILSLIISSGLLR